MKKMRVFLIAVLILTTALVTGLCTVAGAEEEYMYDAARSMLSMINDFRTGDNAWQWDANGTTYTYVTGLSALTYDYDLEATAMLRATEIAVNFSHTRPDGSKWSTAYPSGNLYRGENIASGFWTAASAFEGFLEENEPYSGQGHRRNMLRSEFTRVGIGAVKIDGVVYWVQAFASGAGTVESSSGSSSGSGSAGWAQENGTYVYWNADGSKATGWLRDGGKWYYMDANGYMMTGMQNIGGAQYYFSSSGAMQTGWVQQGNNWYYASESGAMSTGWFMVGKDWYYADGTGLMKTGWQDIGGRWYHLQNSGAMDTGWFKVDGTWYYANSSGAIQTGWQKIDGTWYYFKNDGAMVTGKYKIDGQVEVFSSSGAWEGTEIEDYDTPLGGNPLVELLRRVLDFFRNLLGTEA